MFLRSLTLKGFKSFADATTLQLEPGVTVVVGPNGSGKSNVVDAIAWVLGAQAPSAVRSQKMDDVIFAGTAKRPALGRAEVALTIDNSAGLLPIEFTEVTVSRTLFRTGESEYAINGVNCRLLDVQELLSDAGVGRQQHVIVSQGQIDAVLNARPEDRRSIIEEAAGVLKYRRRKEKAERRLDATEASLLRVQDLLREVRRQLRPLERQAEAARRHGALIGELSGLQVFLAGREIAGLRQRLVSLTAERVDLGALDAELRGQLATLDAAVLAAEAELTARGDADLGDEMVRVEHVRERARGIAAVLVERRRSMERDRGQLIDAGVVANLEADAERARADLVSVAAEREGLAPAAEQLLADEAELVARRDSDDAPAAAPSNAAASAAAETRGELRTLRAAMERVEGEARRLAQRITQLGERAMRLDEQIVTRRAELDDAAGIEGGLVDQLEAAEHRRAAAEQRQATASAARLAAADGHARWQSRAEALRMALESARAKAGADLLTGVEGVVGTLLDVVEIDEGWEPAVEAALGEALQAVVVDSPTAGRRALEALRSSNVHGAVLALGATSPAGDRSSDERLVAGHVRSGRPGVADLVGRLLAGATRVGTWEEGLDLALARPEAVVVTEGGDRFGPTGWRLGAAGGGATAAALDEAQHRSSDAEAELHRWTAELTAADAELAEARRGEQATDRPAGRPRRRLRRLVGRAGRRAARPARRGHRTGDGAAAGGRARRSPRWRTGARSPSWPSCCRRWKPTRRPRPRQPAARHAARAALDTEANRLAARRRELEVHDAGLREREQLLQRRLVETERRLAADAAARAEAHERRVAVERSITAIDRIAELVERHRGVDRATPRRAAGGPPAPERRGAGDRPAARRCAPRPHRDRAAGWRSSASGPGAASWRRPRSACGWRAPSRHCVVTTTSSPRWRWARRSRSCPRASPPRRGCATWSASCACSARSTRSRWRSSPSCPSGTRSSRPSWRTSARRGGTCCG